MITCTTKHTATVAGNASTAMLVGRAGGAVSQRAMMPSRKLFYLDANVTFDAKGGAMPPDWTNPPYYVGKEYGTLPTPTHETQHFMGWYDTNGNAVTTSSKIKTINTTLSAQYLRYQPIEYIQCSNTQYIDVGFPATGGVKYEQKIQILEYNAIGIGSHSRNDSNGYNRCEFVAKNNYQVEVNKCGDLATVTYSVNLTEPHIWIYDAVGSKKFGSIDGNTLVDTTDTWTLDPDTNLTIFIRQYDSLIKGCRFYYGKIWDSSYNLVRDFIPVRVGDIGYLYDQVSGQLFGNAGTGSFILGPDIS